MPNLLNPYRFINIPSSPLIAEYDPSDTGTITDSGGLVSSLANKVSGAEPLTQTTGAAQPLTGTQAINGLNVLEFDGTDDVLSTVNPFYDFTTGASFTIFAIAQGVVDSAFRMVCGQWVSPPTSGNQILIAKTNASVFYGRVGGRNVISSASVVNPSLIIFDYDHTTGTRSIQVNNGAVVSSTLSFTGSLAVPFTMSGVSGISAWKGKIGQIKCYNRILTPTERADISTEFNTKWAVY